MGWFNLITIKFIQSTQTRLSFPLGNKKLEKKVFGQRNMKVCTNKKMSTTQLSPRASLLSAVVN